jgi:hypothetical protein
MWQARIMNFSTGTEMNPTGEMRMGGVNNLHNQTLKRPGLLKTLWPSMFF